MRRYKALFNIYIEIYAQIPSKRQKTKKKLYIWALIMESISSIINDYITDDNKIYRGGTL